MSRPEWARFGPNGRGKRHATQTQTAPGPEGGWSAYRQVKIMEKKSQHHSPDDPLADTKSLLERAVPAGIDRRGFLIRSAVGGAAAVMTGCAATESERAAKAADTTPAAKAA